MIRLNKAFALSLSMTCAAILPAMADNLSVNSNQTLEEFNGKTVTISGKCEVHLTSKTPITNSTVNLQGNDAWLYFDAVKPSNVIASYLGVISIDGAKADRAANVRVAQYRGGTVVIPHGFETYAKALVVYDQANCQGNSKELAVEEVYSDLGAFNNNIRSFVLKKGFQATFANNADGTGHSRVYIADTEDLTVNELPDGFVTKDGSDKAFISYVRVCKHQWVSKKGWCGWNQNVLTFTNSTHSYAWSADYPGDDNVVDREFVPQRHHRGWPGFDAFKNIRNVSHMLGDNEPDNQNDPKEQPSSPQQIAELWPEYLRSGLRVGSPAPTGIWGNWLANFFNICDSLNYRVDYVVYHQYEATDDFKSRIDKAVKDSKGRPVWVTEWNNGANWTNESWPDAKGPRRDANCNIIYYRTDADGNEVVCKEGDEGAYTKEVNRPLTQANANKQLEYMKKALANQDNLDKLERLHFYNAVQDARAVEIDGQLTPAGKYFADYNQKLAYTKKSEFVHEWKIACPFIYLGYTPDYKYTRLTWYDHNGETGRNYIVERRDEDGSWTPVKTLVQGQDYQPGETVVFEDKIDMANKREYRVKATSYKGDASIYSRIQTVWRDNQVSAPDLKGIARDPYNVDLTWNAIDGARAYRLERRDADDAEFKVIAESLNETKYADAQDIASTKDYWYRVSVLSNCDETPVSEIVKVHVPALSEAPEGVFDLMASSGDGQVNLSWAKTYRTVWDVERSESRESGYAAVATDLSAQKYTDKSIQNGKTYWYRLVPKRSTNKSLVGAASAPVQATPAEGNYFYVPFMEGKGGTAQDCYGGKNGTLEGAVWTEGRDGEANGAVKLNSGSKAFVSFPSGFISDLKDFTISLWLKRTGDNVGRVFDFGSSHTESMLFDYGFNNKSGFRYKLRHGNTNNNRDYTATLEKDKWYNIALSQKDGKLTVYLNGEQIGKTTDELNPSALGKTTQNWLGKSMWFDNGDPYPDYAYDDFYIFNRAFTQDEVKDLMSRKGYSGVELVNADAEDDGMRVYGYGSQITVIAPEAMKLNVYTVDGALVRSVTLSQGLNTLDGFAAGIYVVGNYKIMLK